ncbi:TPA: hypothetical protein DDW69_01615 [candidate division CPR2 bacterium]|uniref:Type 4 fimbrial biogenesis protein PilX N-terminal domain-containing protein n=1 Tax=candidate division CPR2 bacterium GW2011_GWC1_41_48 TaxID=1618344 RepID=A0A0G0YJL9_UNCC2|nr:MAG: hypothetical protein UT47_C0001G0126 [candidate division CPR2 bacterium GW2011_GWC2_39_35]KKR28583.1 MAG: hypothetical protein UT60_C0017G0012 [candidate division CPR2 bacterium GW2011_GWD2_39_7]KKR29619.1 MAG: hypothetical protein UT59_C0003G0010 [candidate division CPR2 bacterium GW2011_GWD1_39_7]KKS09721.1 MAG: hypothetical protein UU65_C0001G0126 [candidate division CPR2 bacterium GW2011_GWC1_41_48]OGB56505.1 MAG: hypothetical protein A2Y27_01220 [candidate division CPR2 bacterium G
MNNRGAALLISTITITGILIIVVVTITSRAFSEINLSADDKRSRDAQTSAEAGIKDALIQLVKNQCNPTYSLSENGYSVTINISGCGTSSFGIESIAYSGDANFPAKRMVANATKDLNGKITVTSIKEMATNP